MIDVLAQVSPEVPASAVSTPSPALAALLGALFVTAIFTGIGIWLSRKSKFDDVVRVLIGVFAVAPILLTIPILNVIGIVIQKVIGAVFGSYGEAASLIVGVLLAGLGIYAYYQKGGFLRLLLMTLGLASLIGNSVVQEISQEVINTFGVKAWNLGVLAFNQLLAIKVNLGP